MSTTHEAFADACCQAFRPLVSRYGFTEPEVESIGRECFVRYHKGPRTISVAWEPGSAPDVEFFFPAGPNDEVTPWAARGDVPYSRRIPVSRPAIRYESERPESILAYLEAAMERLLESEPAFLGSSVEGR